MKDRNMTEFLDILVRYGCLLKNYIAKMREIYDLNILVGWTSRQMRYLSIKDTSFFCV